MAIKVPNVGEIALLDRLRENLNVTAVHMHLFKNNHTPADGDTIADYTFADFDGYAFKTLAAFTFPILSAGKAFTTEATQVWLCTGGALRTISTASFSLM